MAFKNVIFDIDGTLIDGFHGSNESWRKALLKITGIDYDHETLSHHFGIPTSRFFEMMNVENTKENQKILDEEYYGLDISEVPIFDNIIVLLDELKKRNIRMGIVTSRSLSDWQDFLRYDLIHYFEEFVVADDTKLHKPNPEPMYEILKRMDIKPEDTIYIGGTVYDKECANGADVKFGAAIWGTHDKTLSGDYNLDDPLEILDLI